MRVGRDLASAQLGVEEPLLGRRPLLIAAVLTLVLIGALLAHRSTRLEPSAAMFAALIVLVGLAPSFIYAGAPAREPYPLLPLTGTFYAVFFGATSLLVDIGWPGLRPIRMYDLWLVETIRPSTLQLILVGLLLLVAGFLIGRWLFRSVPYWRLPRPQPVGRVRLFSWLLLALHSALLYVGMLRSLPSVGQMAEPSGLVSYGVLYYLWRTKQSPAIEAFAAFAIVLPIELLYTWSKGGLADLFILPLFLAFVHIRTTRRIPWKSLIAAIFVFVVAYNINTTFRELTWHKNDPDQYQGETTFDRIALLGRLFAGYVLGDDTAVASRTYVASKRSVHDILGPFIRRTALAVPTEKLMQATPAEVPYWGGESYRNLMTSFIPRIIWPNKPTDAVGSVVADRYGLTFSKEVPTAVNLPWITELYVNFGAPGVVLGMGLIGLFLSLLERIFNRREMTPLEMVVGAAVIFRLFYQESNFTVMTGSILPVAVFFWIYFRVALALPWPGLEAAAPDRVDRMPR